jgi:hypothetical protein
MRTAVHITSHGAQINFGDVTPYLTCDNNQNRKTATFSGYTILLNQEKLFSKPKKTCLKLDNIFLVESWGGVHE